MKELIEKTTTKTGLNVIANIMNRIYNTGRKVAKYLKKTMKIIFDKKLRSWNYVAVPSLEKS